MQETSIHIPVLLNESLALLDLRAGETVIDCNVNRAGHSIEIAKRIGSNGTLIGIDLDITALEEAQQKLAGLSEHPRICLIHNNFRNLDQVLEDTGVSSVDKILFDLGLSSQELDISGRGFTFQKDEPLLMTYDSKVTEETLTAKDILNLWEEETLADIIFAYSDEKFARRIARGIVGIRKVRPFETTFDLVRAVEMSVPEGYVKAKTHFATKTFQALRIAVNDEIGALKEALEKSFSFLKPGGIIVVITFHSLEDRVVKQYFKELYQSKRVELLTKKPVDPTRAEIKSNPRSRSAKVRAIKKIN
jgi:16S rRNA (cytosine1402-N4)-methyltransferase